MSNSCIPGEHDEGIVCLTWGQRIGLVIDVEAGLISLAAVIVALVLIAIKVFRRKKLVDRPMDLFLLVLFVLDIVMALGRITHIKWIQKGEIFQGSYCTAQGILQQAGETGSAMVTITIAIYTFVVVMWETSEYELPIAYLGVSFILAFLFLFIGITVGTQTHGTQHYMTPAGFWCWIGDGSRYDAERYAGEYAWMWAALGVSFLTYIPLSFVALGIGLRINKDRWCRFEFYRQPVRVAGQRRRAISMIAYPLVYCVLVTPISVVRWVSGFGSGEKILPSAASLAVECIYSLSGLANVFIFLFTRSDLFMEDGADTRGFRLNSANGVALPPAN